MTSNQINYWKYKEDARAHQASELETHRHNVAVEITNANDVSEKIRHNKESEMLGNAQLVVSRNQLNENKRHNIANENANIRSITESERHNRATEGYSYANLAESMRHNQTTESISKYSAEEVARSNRAYEDYRTGTLNENIRHNKTVETIDSLRSAWEKAIQTYSAYEVGRHNVAMEAYNTGRLGVDWYNAESNRLQALKNNENNRIVINYSSGLNGSSDTRFYDTDGNDRIGSGKYNPGSGRAGDNGGYYLPYSQ